MQESCSPNDCQKSATRPGSKEPGRVAPRPQFSIDDLLANLQANTAPLQASDVTKSNNIIIVVNGDVIFPGGMKGVDMSGDEYKGNTGFIGPNAGSHAQNIVFNAAQQQAFSEINLESLAEELGTLRSAMMKEASDDPDHGIAVGDVAKAEKAAKAGDANTAFGHLKSAGKWAWDVANKVGVSVAAKAIEGAIGA
jgi:hypothetical protein